MPKPTFNRLPETKKQRLRTALTTVFTENGYDRTSVSDIVLATGMARGSFYQYYTDKFDAFLDLLAVLQADKMVVMQPLLARLDHEPLLDVLPDLALTGIHFAKRNAAQYAIGRLLYTATDPDMQQFWKTIETQGINIYTDFLKKDQAAGFIDADIDPVIAARLLYQFISRDLLEAFYAHGDEATMMAMIDKTIRIFRHGIQKEGCA